MSLLAFHWDLGKQTKLFRQDPGPGSEARLHVLINILSHANLRLRAWPSVEKIMDGTGFNDKTAIAEAIKWLFDHGAIYNVPFDKRVGQEKKLSNRKYVFQLTGIININGQILPYIVMKPEEIENMVQELKEIGADEIVELYHLLDSGGQSSTENGHGRESLRRDSGGQSSTSSLEVLNVSKETLRPAKAGTQPPVITGRSGSEDDPPDPNIDGYTAAELWVYHNQKTKKPLSDSMRGRLNNPPSHLNDKGVVVADETANKLFDTDKAYPIWCVEWVLPALKNTIGANQKHYKPSPSSLIDFMRNLDKFYEWKAKQPEARFKPLRKIISSV